MGRGGDGKGFAGADGRRLMDPILIDEYLTPQLIGVARAEENFGPDWRKVPAAA